MAAPFSTSLQVGNPAIGTVSRRPQTTAPSAAPGVPFTRLSRKSQMQGFAVTGQPFGALINQSLKAVGGYLRALLVTVTASGGAGAAVAAADAPWNIIQSILLRDALGEPIIQCDGYGLYLINVLSGQYGQSGRQIPSVLPSFAPVAASGNFSFRLAIPLELDSSGYCTLASLNASAQPSLTMVLASAAQLYTTLPTTLPTVAVTVDELFWAAPISDPSVAPPDIGSSAQWVQGMAAQQVGGQFTRVTLPGMGTYIHTIIGVLRDGNGVRQPNYPVSDLQLAIDNVPVMIESYSQRVDEVYRKFGIVLPAGVIAYTFRDAVMEEVSSADTHDILLPTTPATLTEIWGTFPVFAVGPGQLTVYSGQLFPVGGVPYTHLAQ